MLLTHFSPDFSTRVVGCTGDTVHVSLSLPLPLLESFKSLLSALHNVSIHIALKAHHEKSIFDNSLPSVQADREQRIAERNQAIFDLYTKSISSGFDQRRSIKLVQYEYPQFNSSQIKMVLQSVKKSHKKSLRVA